MVSAKADPSKGDIAYYSASKMFVIFIVFGKEIFSGEFDL
jgi:hypothetical protein